MADMSLRIEVFPNDLDVSFDFYTRVLRFDVVRDERKYPAPYFSLRRGIVHVGAAPAWSATEATLRYPPQGVEVIFEVDDIEAERAAIASAGWIVLDEITERPWGLRDFHILDPDGTFIRLTNRSS